MKWPVKKTIVFTVAVCFGLFATVWWWHSHQGVKTSFTTAVVKRGDVAASISASGTIEPVEVVDIGAQVAGIIKSFGTDIDGKTIDYGSVVEKDAVLAKIDDSVYAADLLVAKANESAAEANLQQMQAKSDQAAAEWKRAEALLANKLMAQVDYDSDKANYEVANANVAVAKSGIEQARAAVTAAQRNLDFCTIKSPVKGVVIDRRVNIGQTVVSSLNAPSLFLIARDLTKMQIWVAVNEADVERIAPGAAVTFTCDALPGRKFTGTVGRVRLNAQMTQNVVMFTVEVNIENPDNVLLPYLTANVRFVVQENTNVLLVPNAALRWSPSALAEIAPDARQADPPQDSRPDKNHGIVRLKSGDYVRPIEVKSGASDGAVTAIVAGDLPEGAEIVIGESTGNSQAAGKTRFCRRSSSGSHAR
jgi:HlyD family secretion protein